MSGTTVQEFAEKLAKQVKGITLEKLIEQLNRAGVEVKSKEDVLPKEAREKLLQLLQVEHGKASDTIKPKVLHRRQTSTSTLKIKNTAGKTSPVQVVSRKRRVYVKKDLLSEEENEQQELEVTETQETPVSDQQDVEKPKQDKAESKPAETKAPVETEQDKGNQKSKAAAVKAKPAPEKEKEKKKSFADKPRGKSKAQLIQESKSSLNGDSDVRRFKPKRHSKREEVNPHAFELPVEPKIHQIKIPEMITVADLAKEMSVKSSEVIKILMKLGVMVTINQTIDQDTACLAVEELGHTAIPVKSTTIEETVNIDYTGTEESRSPIVTVMGHVDHGKTSLLDYIRSTKVTSQEAGGITQHIGAYQVDTSRGKLTLLDTPGHSAFTAMRARGAKCTDIVVLVVAADDGVMPQTEEAIQHAKAAGVPIIVAINKIDKPEADPDRVINELSQYELIPESWGGDTMFVRVSAKEGTGVDDLLESVMLQAEVMELKAIPTGPAQGVVIEARVDRGRGPVASVLIQQGSLNFGDMLLAGLEYGRIKAMTNDQAESISHAGPSVPVEILGLSGAPNAGDSFQVVENEKKAREVAIFRQNKHREIKLSRQQASKLEGFMDRMKKSDLKTLNIVLKADVQGSVEALVDSLEKLTTEEVEVKVISKGVGGFNESDINLAMASGALLIGFNVRADATARRLAQQEGIEINYYSVIYDVVENLKSALLGLLGPEFKESIIGLAEVRDVFRSSKIGAIAGCMVIDGKIKRGNPIRVLRDNVVIYEGELESLRRFKENVNDVRSGTECGIGVKNYNDVKVGDQIEVFEVIEVKREEL